MKCIVTMHLIEVYYDLAGRNRILVVIFAFLQFTNRY